MEVKCSNIFDCSKEYESIETGQHFTWDNSNMEDNKPKNRYANVVAYDHSRVVLNTIDGIPNSDYINANYIDGYEKVTLLDTLELAHYTIRTMRLQHRGNTEVRDVRHLQYTAWPDHGVPDHPTPFLMFLKRVKTLNQPGAGPIISHCSAGIGRTGAFIVIDCMLERLRYENTVDIYGCVTALRSQRSYMVQVYFYAIRRSKKIALTSCF
uniref:Uncharacterized protein n=1 Tax=Parascaris equorum TaxID=6256 RepID=A0A914SAU5_PAREQ